MSNLTLAFTATESSINPNSSLLLTVNAFLGPTTNDFCKSPKNTGIPVSFNLATWLLIITGLPSIVVP